jgi:hypothetical protein
MVESVRNVSRAKRMVVRFGCVDSFAATIGPLLVKALAGTVEPDPLVVGQRGHGG